MALTIAQTLQRAAAQSGSDSARLDAELLLCACLAQSRSYLRNWPERLLNQAQAHEFDQLWQRRPAGEPVAYLLGSREFWSLPLSVTPATLIPRPDTECLVELALSLELPEQAQVLDLGTGSGAIALALASENPQWHMLAVDKSAEALAVARHNGEKLQLPVHWRLSDWFSQVPEVFDLILANPPYLAPEDPHLNQGDLRFEPQSALVAADEGLADLRRIIQDARQHLKPGGWLLLEHGYNQGPRLKTLLLEHGFSAAAQHDLAGHHRVSYGQLLAR